MLAPGRAFFITRSIGVGGDTTPLAFRNHASWRLATKASRLVSASTGDRYSLDPRSIFYLVMAAQRSFFSEKRSFQPSERMSAEL